MQQHTQSRSHSYTYMYITQTHLASSPGPLSICSAFNVAHKMLGDRERAWGRGYTHSHTHWPAISLSLSFRTSLDTLIIGRLPRKPFVTPSTKLNITATTTTATPPITGLEGEGTIQSSMTGTMTTRIIEATMSQSDDHFREQGSKANHFATKSVALKTAISMMGIQSPMGQYCTSETRPGNTSSVTK